MSDRKSVVDPKVIGARIQRFRRERELTQEALAKGSGISRATLQKLESGISVRHKTIEKIMDFVHEIEWDFTMSIEDWDRPFRVYAPDEPTWLVTFNTPKSRGLYPDGAPVGDRVERDRLGRLGFVSAFNQRIGCDLREGRLRAGLVEIYGEDQKTFRHPEEEFAYCLRGEVRVTIGDEIVDLKEGQAMTFWSTAPHRYGLPKPLGPNEPPALLLMVWTVGKAIPKPGVPERKRRPRARKPAE